MSLFKKKRVFILFTDRTIRYLTWSDNKKQHVVDYGELDLRSLIIEDGKIHDLELLTVTLRKLINRKKWKGADLSFIVPDSFVTMREETIPKQLNRAEAIDYIKLHFEGSIRLPIKDPMIDYYVMDETDEQHNILLFAYPSERLIPFYQLFEQLKLKVEVADISYLSVYRTYLKSDMFRQDEHLLMIQLHQHQLVLTVFHHHIPKFSRQIHFTQNELSETSSGRLERESSPQAIDELIGDQLVSIERFIDFYRYSIMDDQGQVDKLLVTGDFPQLELFEHQLKDRFELPINKVELPYDIPTKFTSLYGLGLRGEDFGV